MKDERVHELIKKNLLTVTKVFDKRVHHFINNILMAQGNPMAVRYYHYRLEFQLRGAPHCHGVLWLDLKGLEKSQNLPNLEAIFNKLRISTKLKPEEKETLSRFIDLYISTSSKTEGLEETIKEVQTHHHTSTCFKGGRQSCRNVTRFSKYFILAKTDFTELRNVCELYNL